jgi:hypothetical protein
MNEHIIIIEDDERTHINNCFTLIAIYAGYFFLLFMKHQFCGI